MKFKLPKKKWTFHKAKWGDLTVTVMPRSDMESRKVVDSNTGVVVESPNDPSLLGSVFVQGGGEPNCDPAALNYIMTGDYADASWRAKSNSMRVSNNPADGYENRNGFAFGKDGFAAIVLRPRDAALAFRHFEEFKLKIQSGEIPADREKAEFDAILDKQDYQFVGYLSADGKVLNADGSAFGDVLPGDSVSGGPRFQQPRLG